MLLADYHTHTDFSDGKASIEQLLQAAVARGLTAVAVTDHFDPRDYRPKIADIDGEALLCHFKEIRRAAQRYPIKVLCGIEITPLPDGTLGLPQHLSAACEVIITSTHYLCHDGAIRPGEFFNDRYWEQFKEVTLAAALGEGTILGHPEEYLPIQRMIEGQSTTFAQRRQICRDIAERYLTRAYIEKLAENLSRSGKACELHCETQTPRGWVVELMARRGVRFTPGSDAHTADHVGTVEFAYRMAKEYGLILLEL